MLADAASMPSKAAKGLPEDAREIFLATYNDDFGWRCSEAHALKAAWRAVKDAYEESEDGTWVRKA